jgi:hypothetical protein
MNRITCLAALMMATACASAGRSTAAPPRLRGTVPLEIVVRGARYAGTAVLGDRMQGTFSAKGPVEVTGTLQGRGSGNAIEFDVTYSIAANGCRGTMKFTGTFTSNTATVASGPVDATDSCVGKMTGTFKVGS